jgi:hypothetical protein
VARSILLVGSVAWLLAGVTGLAVAGFGAEALERLLPPLSIDTDALRGAVTAVGAGLLAVGLAHAVVLIGLRSRQRWGWSASILLAAVLAATLLALGAAAATSAVATPQMASPLLAGTAAAAVGTACYALVVLRLVGERRSGSVS